MPQKCLHCKIETYEENDLVDKVKVIINNIQENEWKKEIDNYLWLLGESIEIYNSYDANNHYLGQIIYENRLKGKLYVKGIFVQNLIQEIKNSQDTSIPGFNADFKINRDRNNVQNDSKMKELISEIISCSFNKNINFLRSQQKHDGKYFRKTEYGFEEISEQPIFSFYFQFKSFIKNIIECLEKKDDNFIDKWTITNKLNKESIELIWDEMYLDKNKLNKQPVDYEYGVTNFLQSKKLPSEFYQYYKVGSNLMGVLEKSSSFISIEKKFSEYVDETETIEPDNNYKRALEKVLEKIQKIKPYFKLDNILFKKFPKIDEDLCYFHNKNVYFSSFKLEKNLNGEWKFWILIKLLKALDVKIESVFLLFENVFE